MAYERDGVTISAVWSHGLSRRSPTLRLRAAGMHTMMALGSRNLHGSGIINMCFGIGVCCFCLLLTVLGPLVNMHMEYTPGEVRRLVNGWYIGICTRIVCAMDDED